MLKKLKQALYNKRTAKELKNIEFENFTYQGGLPYPMFISFYNYNLFQKTFTPESEEMLKLSIEKLKSDFFMKVSLEDFKQRVKTFCRFFHFNEQTVNACLAIYKEKQEKHLNQNNNKL